VERLRTSGQNKRPSSWAKVKVEIQITGGYPKENWTGSKEFGNTSSMAYGIGWANRGELPRSPGYARIFQRLLGDRRGFARLPIFGTMYLRCGGYGMEYTCACFDISARGVGLEMAGPVTVGSFVTVYAGERCRRRLARVRYCVREDDTYRTGLEFAGHAGWGVGHWRRL
jgi:hypothetical protein